MEPHQFNEETSDFQETDFIAGDDRELENIQNQINECEKELMELLRFSTTSDKYSEVFLKKRSLITQISILRRRISR